MIEREHPVSTESIRDNAKAILFDSADLLTLDYNVINTVLTPKLEEFMLDMHPSTTRDSSMSLQESLGVTMFYNVINFCYKDPKNGHEYEYKKDGKIIKRSTGLFTAMASSDVIWADFSEVAKLTPEKWTQIAQLGDDNSMFLGSERGERLKLFADKLIDDGFFTPMGFLEEMDFDTDKILPYFAESGFFDDEFLKRAQLNVRMLDDVFKDLKLAGIRNTNKLTAMADYRLPQVFYNFGAVALSEGLKEKLEKNATIESGSREENALRATVPVIAEILAKNMGVEEGYVDTLLWTLSQVMAKADKLPIPHMIVATDKY